MGLLLALPPHALTRETPSPVHQVAPLQSKRGDLTFQVDWTTPVEEPTILRLLIAVEGKHGGWSEDGFDYLVEGSTLYRYPPDASTWTWDAMSTASRLQREDSDFVLLAGLPPPTSFRWVAELVDAEWNTLQRWPADGTVPARADTLATKDLTTRPAGVDLSELLAAAPPTLSTTFDRRWTDRGAHPHEVAPDPVLDWSPKKGADAWPLTLHLRDEVNREEADVHFSTAQRVGDVHYLEGSALGIAVHLVVATNAAGDIELTGRIAHASDRCLRVTVAAAAPLDGWMWHDDVRFHRAIQPAHRPYRFTGACGYGAIGEQSLYPFGVISREGDARVIETDPREPRIFRVEADGGAERLRIVYDMALTRKTTRFPGQATFRCAFRHLDTGGRDAFRVALAAFYRRYPDFAASRVPRAGLWMPFFDIAGLPGPEDFGFAFLEQQGPRGAAVAYCEANDILTLVYTEPWLYWLPLARETGWDRPTALARMRMLATSGDGQPNEFAASGLLGAIRGTDGEIQMRFLDTPWNTGARMEVSVDPGLAVTPEYPVNRAMSEWRHIQAALADERVDGIYLDSMSATRGMDYNPAALAVADYPCSYEPGVLRPGMPTQVAAVEYVAALGKYLRRQGKYLMGNFPASHGPFYMPHIDIPGEETTWYTGGDYTPQPDAQRNLRRALSGRKPWGYLQAARFENLGGEPLERYFLDCLFWAFQPSFFSHDGANDPYWLNHEWLERDRRLFKTYAPLCRRLSEAGWQPAGSFHAADDAVWIEAYGDPAATVRHLTLRNDRPAPAWRRLEARGLAPGVFLLDPLTGRVEPGAQTGHGATRFSVFLPAGAIAVRDVIAPQSLETELAFLKTWLPGDRRGDACRTTIQSLIRERDAGIVAHLVRPIALTAGRTNRIAFRVMNTGTESLVVDDGTLQAGEQGQAWQGTGISLAPDEHIELTAAVVPAHDSPHCPLASTITVRRGQAAIELRRAEQAPALPPLLMHLDANRIVTLDPAARIVGTLRNTLDASLAVEVAWSGDFGDGRLARQAGPREEIPLTIDLHGEPGTSGTARVAVRAQGSVAIETMVSVVFLSPQESRLRDNRVGITVDGSFPGYRTDALRDGIVDTAGVDWQRAAWASRETAGEHWVRFSLPHPVTASRVVMHWQQEGGVTYTSREGIVLGSPPAGAPTELGRFQTGSVEPSTTVTFPPIELTSIEISQPPGRGSRERPHLLWLREVELFLQ